MLADPRLLAEAAAGVTVESELAIGERLRRRWPADLSAAAAEQVALRGRAAAKFSRWEHLLLTRDGLEQASVESVARRRAERFEAAGQPIVDLCCGIGGDLAAAAAGPAPSVVGVDRDELTAVCARHNARVYGGDAAVGVADVRDLRLPRTAVVFVDPARRQLGNGDRRRGGSEPPLSWCLGLPAELVAVKAAPGLDLFGVPAGWEVEFVAVGRELKEACLWSPNWRGVTLDGAAPAVRRATVLSAATGPAEAVSLVAGPDTPSAPVRAPGRFVLDPSPAVTRAGAVADLAARMDAWQIDPRIAFLSADAPLRSPFGRSLVVEASLPFSVKTLAAELRRLDVGAVDLRRRGLAGDVDEVRRRLKLHGSRRATVLLTRVVNKPWALVCFELASP